MLNYSQLHPHFLNGISQARERTAEIIEVTEQAEVTELCNKSAQSENKYLTPVECNENWCKPRVPSMYSTVVFQRH